MKAKLLSIFALLLMATCSTWAQNDGALNGKFTINASGDKVYFAQGNLQAVCTSADGNAATPEDFTWRFADHQWDYIGGTYQNNGEWVATPTANNLIDGNGSVSAAGTVDLFSWVGASSTLTGTAAYGLTNTWGPGYDWGNGNDANESLKSDWGNLIGDGWFTLSGDEWAYLLNTRSTTSGVRFAKAYVNSVPGIIVLPDDWSTSYYALNSTNTASVGFDTNVISSADWTSSLEAHDAVFLPIAGLRSGGSILNIGGQGFYWTSTPAADVNCACALTFHATAVEPKWSYGVYRGYGVSVRLVKDALKVTGVTLSQTEAALVVGETLALTPTVAPADAKDKTVNWTTSDGSVATVDANGVVTAQGAGTATITVTTTDGAKTATCTVSVTAAAPIAATSAVGTKGSFTDANGQTRLGIVAMLGGEKYAIALSNETDLTGLSGTYTKKVGDYTYYNFADACAKFANNLTDGSYTASNVWRLPTAAEFQNLIALGGSWNGTGYTWTIGGNSLFLPAAGYYDNPPYGLGGMGFYWSSTQPQFLYFNNGGISMPNGGTSSGMPLRLFCRLPEIIETGYAGRVIAADGKMYKTVAAANKFSTASGIVAYYGSNAVETGQTYQGIAIALNNQDRTNMYCSQKNASCSGHTYGDIATALTVKDGIATTAATAGTNAAHGYSHQLYYAAILTPELRPAGASAWSIPSIGQWNLILKGLTGINDNLSATPNATFSTGNVNAKMPADAEGFKDALYWSCTERDNTNMWMMQFNGSGSFAGYTNKENYTTQCLRPVFAFTSATPAYSVSYDANGGSSAPEEQVKDEGSSLTLTTAEPTRIGYTFTGWNTAADGSGTDYAPGAEYTADDDVTLYAQWTEHGGIFFADGLTGWTATPTSAVEGETITLNYSGKKKVKRVTVTKKLLLATVATAPIATVGDIKAGSATALITAGTTADGTMMYLTITTNEKPATTDGFSATVPTAAGLAAGTYYVWYYVKADADHTDSEIAGPVTMKVKDVATVAAAPTAATGNIYGGSATALVNAGTAQGGTMMYAVTNSNTQPASTGGFTTTVPTAVSLAAGTYYVWYYAKADADHIDSPIAGPVTVTVIKAPTLADVFTNGTVVEVKVNGNNDHWFKAVGTYSSGSYTGVTQSNDMNESFLNNGISMTKDGNNLVVWMDNSYSQITLNFYAQKNTYLVFTSGADGRVYDFTSDFSISVNGYDITSTLKPEPKIKFSDLVGVEEDRAWEEIVNYNQGKIYIDDDNCVRRSSDHALLKYKDEHVSDMDYMEVTSFTIHYNGYSYMFEGD